MPGAALITSEDFELLVPAWEELWAAIPGTTPFHHPAWHATWLRHFGNEAAPVFLSVKRDERLIGVAALDMQRDEARELGDHNVRDYAGPLAAAGQEDAVAAGILEWLREDLTPAASFWGLPAGDPMTAALEAAAAEGGWAFEQTHEANCPGVDLPGDFEAFVSALPKHDRHELRRKIRNLEASGSVRFESTGSSDEVAARMGTLFALMRASRSDKDEFLTPTMEAFFRDVTATFARLGMVRLSTLSVDGAAAAMTLSFETAGTVFLYNSGYNPEYAPLAVGLLSKAFAIREAIALGQQRFDFLRGDEDYKRRLGGLDREVVTLRLRTR